MCQALHRLRRALAENDELTAAEAALELDVELVVGGYREVAAYTAVLGILKTLPRPQSPIGQRLVNLLRSHWDYVPADILADARAFCEAASKEFIDAGAYQAMIEFASGEWPGHRASDV